MKSPRLKQPIEQILRGASLPRPDFSAHHQSLKVLYLNEVTGSRKGRSFKRWRHHLFHQGRAATKFAMIGLFVLIGGGTVLAQAGEARPGDVLYGFKRGVERTRVAFARSDMSKLDLKIDFAGQRLEELASYAELDNIADIKAAIEQTEASLVSIDEDLDEFKLSLELEEAAALLTDEQLQVLVKKFRVLLGRHAGGIYRLEYYFAGNKELEIELEDINDILDNELSHEQGTIADGFLVELKGIVEAGGSLRTLGDRKVEVTDISAGLFTGQSVKVEGVLSGGVISARELKFGPYKLERESGRTVFSTEDVLERDAAGYFVSHNGVRVDVRGDLSEDAAFASLVGRTAELRGVLDDDNSVALFRIKVDSAMGVVEFDLRDRALEYEDGTEAEAEQESESEDESDDDSAGGRGSSDDGSDNNDDNSGSGSSDDELEREAEGTLVFSGGQFRITDDGVTYIIQYSGNLSSLVGKKVKAKGNLATPGSITLIADEVTLDD